MPACWADWHTQGSQGVRERGPRRWRELGWAWGGVDGVDAAGLWEEHVYSLTLEPGS